MFRVQFAVKSCLERAFNARIGHPFPLGRFPPQPWPPIRLPGRPATALAAVGPTSRVCLGQSRVMTINLKFGSSLISYSSPSLHFTSSTS